MRVIDSTSCRNVDCCLGSQNFKQKVRVMIMNAKTEICIDYSGQKRKQYIGSTIESVISQTKAGEMDHCQ